MDFEPLGSLVGSHRPRRLTVELLILVAVAACPSTIAEALEPLAEPPSLLLDTEGTGLEVAPGDVFATSEDLAYFSIDELSYGEDPDAIADLTLYAPLWRTDGTREGTFSLLPREISFVYTAGLVDGVLYFVACRNEKPIDPYYSNLYYGRYFPCDAPENVEMWQTDGSRQGTYRVPGTRARRMSYGEQATQGVPRLGLFFFVLENDEGNYELWVADGTADGTRPLVDLADAGFSGGVELAAVGNELFFLGLGAQGERFEVLLGRTDGTAAGTHVFPAGFPERPIVEELVSAADHLFFGVTRYEEEPHPETGVETRRRSLWVLDDEAEAVRKIADLGWMAGFGMYGMPASDRLFLTHNEYIPDEEPLLRVWSSDGTAEGTERLLGTPRSFWAGYVWREPLALPEGSGFLVVTDRSHGLEPWITDGTAAGTELLADVCPGRCGSDPTGTGLYGEPGLLKDAYFFTADDRVHGRELWRWRPETGSVAMVADLCPGECSAWPRVVGRVSQNLFIASMDAEGDWHLWVLAADGTSPRQVVDLGDRSLRVHRPVENSSLIQWEILEDRWIFWARDGESNVLKLWAMDLPTMVPEPPAGPPLTSDQIPGFAIHVRIASGDGVPITGRQEDLCLPETMCVSGALPGRSEVFVRIVGPKPNGNLWPTLVKFTTSTVEVWIEQLATGIVRYYRLDGASPGSSELPGLFDRDGFSPVDP